MRRLIESIAGLLVRKANPAYLNDALAMKADLSQLDEKVNLCLFDVHNYRIIEDLVQHTEK